MSRWTIIPYVNGADLAIAAATDALAQGPDAKCLIIGNGSSEEDRGMVEKFCAESGALAWFHDPPLPSLSATWNRALNFVWGCGETVALVANNDIAMSPDTFDMLHTIMKDEEALLVTATGVEEEEILFAEALKCGQEYLALGSDGEWQRGGPGFSLFLISREGHEKYPFDEALIPSHCEDISWHRTAILNGDGDRAFGTNVRYLHLGGQTLKRMSPERRAAHEAAIMRGSRSHFERCWGGPVNQEKWVVPFTESPTEEQLSTLPAWIRARHEKGEDVSTTALFDLVRSGW